MDRPVGELFDSSSKFYSKATYHLYFALHMSVLELWGGFARINFELRLFSLLSRPTAVPVMHILCTKYICYSGELKVGETCGEESRGLWHAKTTHIIVQKHIYIALRFI